MFANAAPQPPAAARVEMQRHLKRAQRTVMARAVTHPGAQAVFSLAHSAPGPAASRRPRRLALPSSGRCALFHRKRSDLRRRTAAVWARSPCRPRRLTGAAAGGPARVCPCGCGTAHPMGRHLARASHSRHGERLQRPAWGLVGSVPGASDGAPTRGAGRDECTAASDGVGGGWPEAPNPAAAPAPTLNPNPNKNQVRQLQDQRRSPQRPGLPAGGTRRRKLAAMEVRLASLT